jgi:hypothetical protein
MTAPLVQGGQKVLDPFFLGPEITVQDPHVANQDAFVIFQYSAWSLPSHFCNRENPIIG